MDLCRASMAGSAVGDRTVSGMAVIAAYLRSAAQTLVSLMSEGWTELAGSIVATTNNSKRRSQHKHLISDLTAKLREYWGETAFRSRFPDRHVFEDALRQAVFYEAHFRKPVELPTKLQHFWKTRWYGEFFLITSAEARVARIGECVVSLVGKRNVPLSSAASQAMAGLTLDLVRHEGSNRNNSTPGLPLGLTDSGAADFAAVDLWLTIVVPRAPGSRGFRQMRTPLP